MREIEIGERNRGDAVREDGERKGNRGEYGNGIYLERNGATEGRRNRSGGVYWGIEGGREVGRHYMRERRER